MRGSLASAFGFLMTVLCLAGLLIAEHYGAPGTLKSLLGLGAVVFGIWAATLAKRG
ncbi:hypothetical protein KBC99_01210 [Candidatus Saccharibacteria bacterium]|nr:hypothetical protein [Candidatus Saccharibacteria bacterium]